MRQSHVSLAVKLFEDGLELKVFDKNINAVLHNNNKSHAYCRLGQYAPAIVERTKAAALNLTRYRCHKQDMWHLYLVKYFAWQAIGDFTMAHQVEYFEALVHCMRLMFDLRSCHDCPQNPLLLSPQMVDVHILLLYLYLLCELGTPSSS